MIFEEMLAFLNDGNGGVHSQGLPVSTVEATDSFVQWFAHLPFQRCCYRLEKVIRLFVRQLASLLLFPLPNSGASMPAPHGLCLLLGRVAGCDLLALG